jgi:drug/metabolite transporter (DMT)-like permease
MQDLDALDVASVRMWVAAAVVMPLSLLLVGLDLDNVTSQGYMALLYAALIGTFCGMMLAFYNIQRFGATASAMTAYVIPIVAGIAGVLLLGETITTFMAIGMALIIIGIALINERSKAVEGVEV